MTVVGMVELSQVREYKEALKKLDKQWIETMVEKMSKKDQSINKTSIYNILGNKKTHQTDRILFVECAIEYLAELNKRQEKILNKIKTNQ